MTPNRISPFRLAALAAVLAVPLIQAAPAAASASAGVSLGTLTIKGDGLGDKVALRLHPGDPSTLDLDFGDNGVVDGGFARSTFTKIAVDMGGGADSVRIDDSEGSFTDVEATELHGGEGDDTLRGGGGMELLDGGGGNDLLDGGDEADVLRGGPGNDTFTWGAADGDDTVAGGDDFDRLDADGSGAPDQFVIERLAAPRDGQVQLSRDGLSGRDFGSSVLDLEAVEKLHLDSSSGGDHIVASPDVGDLMALDIVSGSSDGGGGLEEILDDDDIVVGSEAADIIAGGPGADSLDGRGGNDTLTGGAGTDVLIGGSGSDALTGGAGADEFGCDGPSEVLDAQPEDLIPAICIQPAPLPPPPAPSSAEATTAAPTGAVLPSGFRGFGRPVVRATREGLRVKVTNLHSGPIVVKVAASERLRSEARTVRYRGAKKSIPAGGSVMLRLRAPRALRAEISAKLDRIGRIVRRPLVTVTNVATLGNRAVRPRLTLRAGSR